MRKGCGLLYSTHQRGTADLLRGRRPNQVTDLGLSKRDHVWLPIPRIRNEACLQMLQPKAAEQPSFWCAVLRGRIPALIVQPAAIVASYASNVFNENTSEAERTLCLSAVITGKINRFPNTRNSFRSYSYTSERFAVGDQKRFAWPLFMVAQHSVLKKDYKTFRTTLENPDIDEAKAFEAAVQLSVLVRLLTK